MLVILLICRGFGIWLIECSFVIDVGGDVWLIYEFVGVVCVMDVLLRDEGDVLELFLFC